MPPPTAVDPWLTGRRFGIVIDAGSSGSRLQIYSWKDPRIVRLDDDVVSNSLPKVEKGVKEGEEWVSKVEPGLSSFANDLEGVPKYLAPLLEHARSHVPPSLQPETPLFLLATAGMRLLPPTQQAEVLQETCTFLRLHSNFRIDDRSISGPCGSSVRIITGEEEGLFGWIAVNYLMDGFSSTNNRTTYGFLDMGGASTQIAFEPADVEDSQNLLNVRLRRLGGEEIHHNVFVTTWLGYGTNQARQRYVAQVIDEYEQSGPKDASYENHNEEEIILDPCLPKDLKRAESPMRIPPIPSTAHNSQPHILLGTGSFEQCLQKTLPLLNKGAPCPDTPCLFNGVYVPRIDFSVSHFIGVSEYWYSSEHVFGLGGPYDFVQYERAASKFCAQDWSRLVKQHEAYRKQGRLGGDGEVEEGGKVVGLGKWSHKVGLSRLEMQCFKAAWLANVLHEGIGMPRIVDPGGNVTTDVSKVAQQAENKGLGRPTFQSLDTVGDIAISWTLGKMVLEASKEVPLYKKTDQPLADPLDDMPLTANSPFRPIRPSFSGLDAFEDRLSRHLPSSLSRVSLGFSPVLFLLYAIFFCIVISVTYRLRRYLRRSCFRFMRGPFKRDSDIAARSYMLEEGASLTDGATISRPGTPTFSARKKILNSVRWLTSSSKRPRIPPIATIVTQKAPIWPPHGIPARASPTRSYSTPTLHYQNGSTHTIMTSASQFGSRSSSPSHEENGIPSGLSSLSRSRNSSQLNLTSTITRQAMSMSRVNSNSCVPGVSSRDE